jgi:hypothetical protein
MSEDTSIQELLGRHTLKDVLGVVLENGDFMLTKIILSNGEHLPIDVDAKKEIAYVDDYFIKKI